MCTNPKEYWDIDSKYFTLPYLLKRVERFYQGKAEFLENYRDTFSITGGEPTLQPHLITIIKRINELFPAIKIICLTNGRMFSYEAYAKEFFKLDANLELAISVHGHNTKLHDKITQTPGSFLQLVKGLENIFRFKKSTQLIEIRIVIHQLNYKFLEEIIKFIKVNFPQVNRLVLIFFEIEGQACRNLARLKLTYSKLSPYISNIFKLIHYFSEVRFYHFPLCTLPSKFFSHIWRTLPKVEVAFTKNCKNCKLRGLCLGIPKGYLRYIGPLEFRPVNINNEIETNTNWHHPIKSIRKI
jgi:MoaA/NifB/PqqE/SkfB family radical SAM enzyme